jgi:hypothetical protein
MQYGVRALTNHFERDSRRSRKRGTPNAFSKEDKSAIIEAADRVGYDLNGKDGIFGYLRRLAEYHPKVFAGILLIRILKVAPDALVPKSESATELNQAARAFLGLPIGDGTKRQKDGVQSEPGSPWAWTGQPEPVGPLMDAAVRFPKNFCKLLRDAFFPPRSKRRRAPTRPIFG